MVEGNQETNKIKFSEQVKYRSEAVRNDIKDTNFNNQEDTWHDTGKKAVETARQIGRHMTEKGEWVKEDVEHSDHNHKRTNNK
jgi:hypothetical protein